MPPTLMWISWQHHLRTAEICKALGFEQHALIAPVSGKRKYFGLVRRTLQLLHTRRPSVLIVQNPSIVLTTLTVLWRPVFRYALVVDAHNEAVEPYNHPSGPIRRIARWLLSKADLTIVTNRHLATLVHDADGKPFVLPDKIPVPPPGGSLKPLSNRFNLVLIATFADDEPYAEVFAALKKFSDSVTLYVTGNPKKIPSALRSELPGHIVFTGFLAEPDYWDLLVSANAIIDLTRMDNCLVCGAYEAVAVQRPLILSDNRATREHFSRGVIYTKNTVDDIREAIEKLLATSQAMTRDIAALKLELEESWKTRASALAATLTQLASLHRSP